jgi:AsmA protein
MKRILVVLGVLIALLIAVALALPFFIDANQFRPRLEVELAKALGREVKLGDLKLAIFEGGVTAKDLTIADDPTFSKTAFLSAKSLRVGVELMPLIFSRALHITGITIDGPQIALIQSEAGVWNFASLGGKSESAPAESPAGGATPAAISVKLLKITNGRVSLKLASEPKPNVLDKLTIEVKDFSPAYSFPFSLSANLEGGGDFKLTGKAGPIDPKDASATPWDAALKLNKLDIIKSGFVRASTGFAGLVSVDGTATFNGHNLELKGSIQAERLKLAKAGTPARKTVGFDFELDHDLMKRAGTLHRGEARIGSAKAELTGTYRTEGNGTVVSMKLAAPSMAISQLTEMLPALAIVLPRGSSLEGGTVAANLTVAGPTDMLVSDGSVAVKKTRLVGFDLGSNMKTIAKLTGVKISPDTDFDNLSADVHAAPAGVRVDNISVIAPAVGELSGAGTIDPANALNFKMRAKLKTGGVMSVLSTGGETAIPFSIAGTSAEPKFVPDVKGMVGGIAAGKLKPLDGDIGKAAGGLINLFGRKKTDATAAPAH